MTELQGTNRSIRIEGSAHSSTIVSGDHNVIIQVFQQSVEQSIEALADRENVAAIGANPYMGLAAFKETDADRYFGREAQINKLWERFRDLYERSETPRVLPILGPSGCGKSSLVRAGLLPELVQRPLPVRSSMRVAAMTPGAYPLESLASVLAEVNPTDPLLSGFEEELKQIGRDSNEYEGLRRIANRIRDIRDTPLIILIDQFEEVYSLCKQPEQQRAFIQNLLHAASDPTGNVSVIFTLRTDFVGETQRYDQLNQIICAEGVLIPGMTKDELRRAIAEPARLAGYTFDDATVDLLVNDTEGREGALPLLQFALTQIWEGLRAGQAPIMTYQDIGGVGGALAGEAQKIYDKLTEPEKQTTQRIFIGLIQLGEGTQDTRRRAIVENLVASQDTVESVRRVIQQFSSPSTRLISLSSQDGKETAEITHEALIQEWKLLQYWIKENQEKLIQRDKIELAAEEWETQGKSNDYLWQGKLLDSARLFRKLCGREFSLSKLAKAFITQSLAQRRKNRFKLIGIFLLIPSTVSAFVGIQALDELSNRPYWNVINSHSESDPASSRRLIEALQELNRANRSLANIDVSTADLSKIELRDANLRFANLQSVNLWGANLQDADLSGANLQDASLPHANLHNANFHRANLRDAGLGSANLNQAYFVRADLSGAYIGYSDLRGAAFGGAYFENADLKYANLTGVNLDNARLCSANIERASLARASLRNVRFINANLSNTDLKAADLLDADFRGANLNNADLRSARGLTIEQIQASQNWQYAIYDDDFHQSLMETTPSPAEFNNSDVFAICRHPSQ